MNTENIYWELSGYYYDEIMNNIPAYITGENFDDTINDYILSYCGL